MLIRFQHTSVLSIVKWKLGERTALETADNIKGRLHVVFDIPPAGDYDHEKQRSLSPTEHVRLFGRRLRKVWGQLPAFIDAEALDDQRHKEGFAQHPLTELLERARIANAMALPVTSIGRSDDYQGATRRFIRNNPDLPICIRAYPSQFESPGFPSELERLLTDLECPPSRVFFVMDFKNLAPLSNQAVEEFALLVAERISELPFLHRWSGLAVALSSFPADIKLKPGEGKIYPRTDLLVYESLISSPGGLLRTPMFGDYAVDVSPVTKSERRTPSAHIRYSTPAEYIVEKGTSVRKPYGYEAIRAVAKRVVKRPEYFGPSYSQGDGFFYRLAQEEGPTGNAATWRWASTDHHFTVNLHAINRMFGIAEEGKNVAQAEAEQGFLFPELDSPPMAPEDSAATLEPIESDKLDKPQT